MTWMRSEREAKARAKVEDFMGCVTVADSTDIRRDSVRKPQRAKKEKEQFRRGRAREYFGEADTIVVKGGIQRGFVRKAKEKGEDSKADGEEKEKEAWGSISCVGNGSR